MKKIESHFFFLIMLFSLLFTTISSSPYYTIQEEKSFLMWMRTNGQLYSNDEYHFRLGIYLTNLRLVRSHNSGQHKFKVSLNQFACMTPAEYRSLLGYRRIKKLQPPPFTLKPKSTSLDWRTKGVVNEIKDQGNCGSCWAFSAIQTVESVDCIQSGTLLSLSEQCLVDCVLMCFGCSGGSPYVAISYIVDKMDGKFCLEKDYVYSAVMEDCKFDQYPKYGFVRGYLPIAQGDEDDLAAKCEKYGPVAVCVDANNWSFQVYNSGIYDEKECYPTALNHAIGCVGFGVEDETKYWIVKNSWGKHWGEEGYMRMIWENNRCGIASEASVAIA